MMNKRSKSTIALSVAWILLGLVRGWNLFPDAFRLLFGPDKAYIMDQELVFSRHDLWRMHEGLWNLLGVVAFGVILITELIRLRKGNKTKDRSQQNLGPVSSEPAPEGAASNEPSR